MLKYITSFEGNTFDSFKEYIEEINLYPLESKKDNRHIKWIGLGTNFCSLKPDETGRIRHKILTTEHQKVQHANQRINAFFSTCMKKIFNSAWHGALVSSGESSDHFDHRILCQGHIVIPVKDASLTYTKSCTSLIEGRIYTFDGGWAKYKIEGLIVQVYRFADNYMDYYPEKYL